MKGKNVLVGETYAVKVSGRLAPVRLVSVSPYGGWNAVNTVTGRAIRIRSAAKLRYLWDGQKRLAAALAKPDASGFAPFDTTVVEQHITADARMGRDWHSPNGCACGHCSVARKGGKL